MKRILLIAILMLPLMSLAQKAPDNDSIFRVEADGSSPDYYPNLYGRYISGDTTLTAQQYRCLYYGFAWSDDYRPMSINRDGDPILAVFSETKQPDSLQCLKIIESAKKVMIYDPFSPTNLNFLVYAYGRIGDWESEKINADRLNKVLGAIRSSGDGLKEESAWHVLMFSHAIDFMSAMGIESRKPMVISRTVEYVPYVAENGRNKGYYFNYGRAYWKVPDVIPTKSTSNAWQINGVKTK